MNTGFAAEDESFLMAVCHRKDLDLTYNKLSMSCRILPYAL